MTTKTATTLADTIRSIKAGKKKRVIATNANVARATAARVLGAGNYTVHALSNTEFEVSRTA